MEFINGYPKINGSSDLEDSSHLAAILVLTDHHQAPDMKLYFDGSKYIRCIGSKYDCSRDQGIMLLSANLKQGNKDLVRTDYIKGRDILLPSVHGIETIAKGQRPTWLQRKCLEAELKFDGASIEEPFQNMAKVMSYDLIEPVGANTWLKLWTEINPVWDVAILNYLRGGKNKWRNEPELAEYVIKYIEDKIND